MKNDIDLLAGFNEAKDKKSSSNTNLILVVGVLIIVGVMVFLFVSAKMDVKNKEEELHNLEAQLQDQGRIDALEHKIEADKARYNTMLVEAIKEVYSGNLSGQATEISNKVLDIIFDNYARQKDEKGDDIVRIGDISVNGETISFACATKTYQATWDFFEYLRGTLEVEKPALGATEEEIKAYEEKKAAIEANARYFSGVMEQYPGLPIEPDGKDYSISFSLSLKVNWEALAQDETK